MINAQTPSFFLIGEFIPEKKALRLVPKSIAYQYLVVPLWMEGDVLVIAATSRINEEEHKELERITRLPIKIVIAVYSDLINALERIYDHIHRTPDTPNFLEILTILGYINRNDLDKKLGDRYELTSELKENVINYLNEDDFAEAVGWELSIPHITKAYSNPGPALEIFIPKNLADEYQVLPLWWIHNYLYIAIKNDSTSAYEKLADIIGVSVIPIYCPPNLWNRLYRNIYLYYKPKDEEYGVTIINSLFRKGSITETDMIGINALKEQTGLNYFDILIKNGIISEDQWLKELAIASKIDLHKPDSHELVFGDSVNKQIPRSIAENNQIIPLKISDESLTLGLVQPNISDIKLVENFTGLSVNPVIIRTKDYYDLISTIYDQYDPPSTFPNTKQILLGMGLMNKEQLHETILGKFPFYQFLENGFLSDYDIAEALSIQTSIPKATLDYLSFNEDLIKTLPTELVQQHQMIPVWCSDRDLWLAIANPFDTSGLEAVEELTGLRVRPLIAPRSTVASTIERYYGKTRRRIGREVNQIIDKMVSTGYLTQKGVLDTINAYSISKEPLDSAIGKFSIHTPVEIAIKLAEIASLPFVKLNLTEIEVKAFDPLGNEIITTEIRDPVNQYAAKLISLETARRLTAIPIKRKEDKLIVAFADPIMEYAVQEIDKETGLDIIPVIAERADINSAIERILGRRNLGTYLLMANEITRAQLNDALDLANRTGVRLGKALTIRRYISQEQLYQALSRQSGFPFVNLGEADWDEEIVLRLDESVARKYGMIPINQTSGDILLAVSDPFDEEGLLEARKYLGDHTKLVIATDTDIDNSLLLFYSTDYLARSVSELLERSPRDSAYRVLSLGQQIFLVLFLLVATIWGVINFNSLIITLNVIATTFYLSFSFYKFYLINKATSQSLEVPVTIEELSLLDDKSLPVYTILIPVYKEAKVLIDLLSAMLRLDYPETKLDIIVLMEADDTETIQAFEDWNPPPHFHGIIVPYAEPKTKPKACNYGLIHARGDYVVIFDAEDIPEPDQLKRVLVAFSKSQPDVVCIQAKLNYFNSRQNLLTSWFTVEYSMWFDLFLPGLAATKAPIPLGGTSNHFRREVLIEAGAWDPYNVTEDADLGIRVHKRKYRTAVVDTTTYEEANSNFNNWIRQRSRWIKGYIQTWLVHMRHPIDLLREIGFKDFLSFQFVIGGTFFTALLNPIYWILTSIWFFFKWQFIQEIFPGIIFYFGAICLLIGNFVFTYTNVVGAMRRGYYDLVKYALLSPIYWGFASIAGWKGLWQLITKPHYWEKTKHGFYKQDENEISENKNTVPGV